MTLLERVDHTLIGVLVELALACVVPSKYVSLLDPSSPVHVLALLAGAFLIGLVYDQFSESLVAPLARRPIPDEQALLLRALAGSGTARRANSLGARIRLMRAVLTILPGLFLCLSLAITGASKEERIVGGGVVGLLYGGLFLFRLRGNADRRVWSRDPAWVVALVLFVGAGGIGALAGRWWLGAILLLAGVAATSLAYWTWRRLDGERSEFLGALDARSGSTT